MREQETDEKGEQEEEAVELWKLQDKISSKLW